MGQRRHKRQNQQLYDSVVKLAARSAAPNSEPGHADISLSDEVLAASPDLACVLNLNESGELTKMKKFRFQLLHRWLIKHIAPARVADIGGGKGLLAYLLKQDGWQATVIDPVRQALPTKYKDLGQNKQILIPLSEQVPRLTAEFDVKMARDFDLLIGLHAHGCNIKIIDAAAQFQRDFILMPCCIIHEPIYPPLGVHWLQCVIDYATRQGFAVEPFRLNFKGQNIGFYGRSR